MKEEKKTSGGNKRSNNNHRSNTKNYSKNANHNNVKRNNFEPKNKVDNEAPKVREIKNVDNTQEDEDKKLIVLIALAILIIVGTVIGLLVGLNKEGGNEENITNVTNNTVPVTDIKDIIEGKDEDDNEYVVKTTASTTTNKYQISYYLNGKKVYSTKVSEGAKIKKYVPSGYTNCSYYSDSEHSTKFNFSETASDDAKVYLVCKIKEYTVTYKDTNMDYSKEVKLTGSETEGYVVENYPYAVSEFLGWSKDGSNKIYAKPGKKINLKSDLTLTPVFGDTTVVYENVIVKENDDETLVVDEKATEALNKSTEDEIITDLSAGESDDEGDGKVNSVEVGVPSVDEYSLPSSPAEVGLDTPTYFVPVDPSDPNSKLIVSDDTEEIDDKKVKLKDVQGRTPDWYAPSVDDNVKEKDYDFAGFDKEEAWKPSKEDDADNTVKANWKVQEEDKNPPAEEKTSGEPEKEPVNDSSNQDEV